MREENFSHAVFFVFILFVFSIFCRSARDCRRFFTHNALLWLLGLGLSSRFQFRPLVCRSTLPFFRFDRFGFSFPPRLVRSLTRVWLIPNDRLAVRGGLYLAGRTVQHEQGNERKPTQGQTNPGNPHATFDEVQR